MKLITIISMNTQGRYIVRLIVHSIVGLSLVIFQSLPIHARMDGMVDMKGIRSAVESGPEEQAQQIAEKLSLSKIQQVEVVYVLERMFSNQLEYLEQAKSSGDLSQDEVEEKMQDLKKETLALVGDFLNDTKLDQLIELLKSDIKNPTETGPRRVFHRAERAF